MAWGPNGLATGAGEGTSGDASSGASSGATKEGMDAQTEAAVDALVEIGRCKSFLEKKEDVVLYAEEEVVALKA